MSTRKHLTAGTVAGALLLLVFALAGAAVFYGFMVYQSVPEEGTDTPVSGTLSGLDPAHLLPRTSPVPGEPVPVILLQNLKYIGRQTQNGRVRDQDCTQMTDVYVLDDGRQVRAITAWPPAWLETLAGSGWVPQLITGFSIGTLPAVFYLNGSQSMLIAREDPYVYAIQVTGEDADGQTVYALGVLASVAANGTGEAPSGT